MPVSRAQGHGYYAPTHTVTPGYYYDDTEGYVGDYSESDGLSDAAHLMPNDVTELYRRKALKECYRELYDPQYFYEVRPVRKSAARTVNGKRTTSYQVLAAERAKMPFHVEHLHRRTIQQVAPPQPLQQHHRHCRLGRSRFMTLPTLEDEDLEDGYEGYDTEYGDSTPAPVTPSPPRRPATVVAMLPQSRYPRMMRQKGGAAPTSNPQELLVVPNVKQRPVTVRTPRYYRRPATTTLLAKQPSALCMPLASRPDPAVYRKSRRPSTTQHHVELTAVPPALATVVPVADATVIPSKTRQQMIRRASELATSPPREAHSQSSRRKSVKGDSQAELGAASSHLDEILTQYEEYFDNRGRNGVVKVECYRTDVESIKSKVRTPIHPVRKARIKAQKREKILQRESNKSIEVNRKCSPAYEGSFAPPPPPPPPSSHQQLQQQYQQRKKSADKVLSVQTKDGHEDTTSEMLDSLLADLMKNGCNNKIQEHQQAAAGTTTPPSSPGPGLKNKAASSSISANFQRNSNSAFASNKQSNNSLKSVPLKQQQNISSINYQEITAQKFSDCENNNDKPISPPRTPKRSSNNQLQLQKKKMSSTTSGIPSTTPSKMPLDEKSIMELHKSKSYIVNLIDRALSRELGTIPDEKYNDHKRVRGGYAELSPQAAVDMVKTVTSNASRLDKDLRVEITQALTESLISNGNAAHKPDQTELNSDRCSNVAFVEEPAYVKELKQLRWGHLRHIQREVRRLEDLERFLESCSSGSSFINSH